MSKLSNYTLSYFKEKMNQRFFPRKLIVSRDDNTYTRCVLDSLDVLNESVYLSRVYEFQINGSIIDLTQMNDVKGIEVGKVQEIVPASDYYTFFENFRLMMGNAFFLYNSIRYQDSFIDFILSSELQKQLNKRYRNYFLNWKHFGDKIILGNAFSNSEITKCLVFFLPRFIINDSSVVEWELYDTEEKFVSDYLEALISYREGRAQSEMTIMGVDNNSDNLQSEGKEELERLREKYRRQGFTRVGKRF